jgi:hypothetical protein
MLEPDRAAVCGCGLDHSTFDNAAPHSRGGVNFFTAPSPMEPTHGRTDGLSKDRVLYLRQSDRHRFGSAKNGPCLRLSRLPARNRQRLLLFRILHSRCWCRSAARCEASGAHRMPADGKKWTSARSVAFASFTASKRSAVSSECRWDVSPIRRSRSPRKCSGRRGSITGWMYRLRSSRWRLNRGVG